LELVPGLGVASDLAALPSLPTFCFPGKSSVNL
jgi:hypothetical protein